MIQIPFHPRFTEEIERGEKRFTLRLRWNKKLQPGDPIELVDGNRDRITTEEASLVAHVPAGFIPSWKFEGHREYATFDALQNELAEYYPEEELTPNTVITVIGW